MDAVLSESLKEWPMALLFAYFLFLSFRQRKITTDAMLAMVTEMVEVIQECCGAREGRLDGRPSAEARPPASRE